MQSYSTPASLEKRSREADQHHSTQRDSFGNGSQPTSSRAWVQHFKANRWDPHGLVDCPDVELSKRAKKAIAKSIATFQLGESGEGRHFLRVARKWAQHTGDYAYVEALQLFIAEEQNHSAALGAFMDKAGIPRIRKELSDNAFRWLRHQAGLELTVTVLVTAEIVARVYYPALRRATSSHWLRKICEQVSRDEVAHIRFQGQRLGIIQRRKSRVGRIFSAVMSQMLFDSMSVLVWFAHRSVFRAANMSFREYWTKCSAEYRAARRQVAIGMTSEVTQPEPVAATTVPVLSVSG